MNPAPTGTPAAATRRIVTERRQRPLRIGIGPAVGAVGKSRWALDLIGLGVVGVGLIGVWLIIIGWRGRRVILADLPRDQPS